MKKASVIFVFAICAAVGLSFNASAADVSDIETFGAFLDAESGSCDPGVSTGGGVATAGTESICSISTWCPGGAPQVSCDGDSTCLNGTICNGLPYVECDGNRVTCSQSWCSTQTCCHYKTCDYWCQAHGYGPIGGCYQGCCECAEM